MIRPKSTLVPVILAKRDSCLARLSAVAPALATRALMIVLLACFALTSGPAAASSNCPFCSSVNLTFTDQIAAKDVVVSAKLLDAPPLPEDPDADLPKATFEITKVLKGDEVLEKGMEFQALLVGRYPKGKEFLVMGIDPPNIAWTTPVKAAPVLLKYLEDIQKLPESGADRLAFFQEYFEHEESSIAFDAYDEFAKAPYSDLLDLKDRMDQQQLLAWIIAKDTSINRRRLYLTMLGVCGNKADGEVLEKMISDGGDSNLRGLDALLACYLCLKGDAGVDLVEKKFLTNEKSDFTTTMDAVSALRFHGTEVEAVSRERIISAVRKLLDRPKMADLIISDLARWEDWEATDKLVAMFKASKKENRWLRVPIVAFLMASPEPRAKDIIVELKKIDPGSIERAQLFGGGFFDDDEDDDSDAERADADMDTEAAESELLESKASLEPADSISFVSTGPDDDPNPFAELDRAVTEKGWPAASKIPTEPMPSEAQSRHTSYKVPISPGATLSTDQTSALAAGGKELSEVTSLSTGQGESSSVAVATETASTVAPVVATAAVSPVAAVPYLTLKIILIPFVCSIALFFLLWSVVNGSFQRLIF